MRAKLLSLALWACLSPPAVGADADAPAVDHGLFHYLDRHPDQSAVARGDWLDATIEIIEATTKEIPNHNFSQDEWKCQVAERQFSAESQRSYGRGHPMMDAALLRVRWAEEVVFFYCLGEPFADVPDSERHRRLLARHITERYSWRPHHLLPGPPGARTGRRFVAENTALCFKWEHFDELQALRLRLMPLFMRRDEALLSFVSPASSYANSLRLYLRSMERFGRPMLPEESHGRHFTNANEVRMLMRFLAGVRDEAHLFADANLPAPDRYSWTEVKAMMDAGILARRSLYEDELRF